MDRQAASGEPHAVPTDTATEPDWKAVSGEPHAVPKDAAAPTCSRMLIFDVT